MKKYSVFALTLLLLLLVLAPSMAQDAPLLPTAWRINGGSWEKQWWNNCGPATITNTLRFFGYNPSLIDSAIANDQGYAQSFLKPDSRDKNVNPWQLVDFVNSLDLRATDVPVHALLRYGGNLTLLKTLIASNFPVIIEEGYDPVELNLGWMGHYLLLTGFDDAQATFISQDSFEGANFPVAYADVESFWQHFNYSYVVVYDANREAELLAILGADADEWTNIANAYNLAVTEASAYTNDAFAWFNIGTNLVYLARYSREHGDEAAALQYYNDAARAYNQARSIGLPWRMLWYQFGIYEAYFEVVQADNTQTSYLTEILSLANTTIEGCVENDGLCHIEEAYYWAGRAREALGEDTRALNNYNTAIQINRHYEAAIQARDNLLGASGS